MNSSDTVETPGSVSLTPQTQTPRQNESLRNVGNQRNKRNGSNNSLGMSYCCF